MKRAIVYCCDSNGTAKPWLEYSLNSLRKFGDYDVFVASPTNLCIPNTRWIPANEYIKEFKLDRIMKLRYHRGSCDPMILFRLVLPIVKELAEYDRFLYIDCDTEIMAPLDEVFEIPKADYDMAAVKDFGGFCKKHCPKLLPIASDHRLSCRNSRHRLAENLYINSGVIMFYPQNIMVRHNFKAKVLNLLDVMIEKRLFWDQDLINIGFKINLIDRKWNGLMDREKHTIKRGVAIAHFIGKAKLKHYPPEWRYEDEEKGTKIVPSA